MRCKICGVTGRGYRPVTYENRAPGGWVVWLNENGIRKPFLIEHTPPWLLNTGICIPCEGEFIAYFHGYFNECTDDAQQVFNKWCVKLLKR